MIKYKLNEFFDRDSELHGVLRSEQPLNRCKLKYSRILGGAERRTPGSFAQGIFYATVSPGWELSRVRSLRPRTVSVARTIPWLSMPIRVAG